MSKTYNVAVVGLGYVGLVIATVLANRGCRVFGVDTNKKIVDATNAGKPHFFEPELEGMLSAAVSEGRLTASTDMAHAKEATMKLVTVGTPLGDKLEPDLRAISAVAKALADAINPNDIVLLKSTVTPGVTEETFGTILQEASGLEAGKDFFLAFSPERLAEGKAVQEFATLPIVVGSSSSEAEETIATFWRDTLGVDVIKMGSPIAAELVKLADNLWIDVNIALANLVAIVANSYGITSDEIIKAANSLPKGAGYVNILQSSIGVGGSCLTKDPLFFATLVDEAGGDSRLVTGARKVNEGMPKMVAGWVDEWVEQTPDTNRETAKVALVGLAFKDDTSDLRYSPMIDFYREVAEKYPNVVVHDPFIEDEDTAKAFPGATIAGSVEEALDGAAVAVFGCNHSEFRKADVIGSLNHHMRKPGLVVDGRKAIRHRLLASEGQLDANLELRSV